MTEVSKHPLSDLGDDFDPERMPDYKARKQAGEFEGKTEDEVRNIYFEEEIDDNHEHEQRKLDEQAEDHDD